MRPIVLAVLAVLVFAAPAVADDLDSLLWMQTSAEYRALCVQTYRTAGWAIREHVRLGSYERDERGRLVKRMYGADGRAVIKPVAVVMDLDETVLDNSPFEAFLVKTKRSFDPRLWDAWVRYQATTPQARAAVPGAVDFIRGVEDLGVSVVYVSNRDEGTDGTRLTADILTGLGVDNRDPVQRVLLKKPREEEAKLTQETVARLGVAPESLEARALVENQSAKQRRRLLALSGWYVIGWFGDDLNDFPIFISKKTPVGQPMIEARFSGVDANAAKWGTEWFVLPNPIYGSWQGSLPKENLVDLVDDRGFSEAMKAVKP